MKKGALLLAFLILLFSLLGGCQLKKTIKPSKKTIKISNNLFEARQTNTKLTLNSVSFVNPARGITVGDSGTMLITKNGGYNWISVGGVTTLNLYGVTIVDKLTLVAVGEQGTVIHTTNGTASWSIVSNIPTLQTLRGVAFFTDKKGYAVGDSGVILFTADAGFTWTKKHGKPAQTLNGISYNSDTIPYVAANGGIVLKSMDGGNTWTETNLTRQNLNSIHFALNSGLLPLHTDTGFVVGNNGTIFKTTDGGSNWNADVSTVTRNLRSVFLTSSSWGYAVGDTGTVLRYNGTNWTLLSPPTLKRLNGVDPGTWSPTSTCVGEDGLAYTINPPPVNDGGSTVNVWCNENDCSTWNFDLVTQTLHEGPTREGFSYSTFEVCSSMDQATFGGGGPNTGWARNENFYSRSVHIESGTTYPNPPDYPLDPLNLQTDATGGITEGYLTCYFLDQYGNPHLLGAGVIYCNP